MRRLSDAEWNVMNVLWNESGADGAATVDPAVSAAVDPSARPAAALTADQAAVPAALTADQAAVSAAVAQSPTADQAAVPAAAAQSPAAAPAAVALGDVVERLKPVTGWSRNTVLTYLTRMEGKGLVVIDRENEPHRYMAAVTREECAVKERSNLLNRVYGGSAGNMIAAFLRETKISPEEREELRKLLDEMEV